MYIPYNRSLMLNIFGLHDYVWGNLFLISILYVCFLTGLTNLSRKYISILSISLGIITGFLHFVFIGSAEDQSCGMLLVAIIFPLFCRITSELGSKFREYWNSTRIHKNIPISQINVFLLSILFLSNGIYFTYLTYTWHQRFKNTDGTVLSQTWIDFSRYGDHIISYKHNWPYPHGYVLIVKPNRKILSKEQAESAIQDMRIRFEIKKGEVGISSYELSNYKNIKICKDSTGEYTYQFYHPQLIYLEAGSYNLDIFIYQPASTSLGYSVIFLKYTIDKLEMKSGIAISSICYILFLCLVFSAYIIYRRNQVKVKREQNCINATISEIMNEKQND